MEQIAPDNSLTFTYVALLHRRLCGDFTTGIYVGQTLFHLNIHLFLQTKITNTLVSCHKRSIPFTIQIHITFTHCINYHIGPPTCCFVTTAHTFNPNYTTSITQSAFFTYSNNNTTREENAMFYMTLYPLYIFNSLLSESNISLGSSNSST